MSDYRIETKCIQSGYEPGNGEARVLPIYQLYEQRADGKTV
jgi:O-acetylhomoserine (thiol)-lyase